MVQGRFINASSSDSWSKCHRRAWYDYNIPPGFESKRDPLGEILSQSGSEHEVRLLAQFPDAVKATSYPHTLELMERGTRVIYQPILLDEAGRIEGRPDFLVRTDRGTYQVLDAKLALSLHDEDGIQLSVYRKLLGNGEPAVAHLGDGTNVVVPDRFSLKAEEFTASMRAILDTPTPPTAPFAESRCRECPYDSICRPSFIQDGEITLVYGIDSRMVAALAAQGINTIRDLAAADPETMKDVPYLKGIEKRRRAVLQARSLLTGEIFQVAPVKLPEGTFIHFDVETNPLAPGRSQPVYLWGLLKPPYDRSSFEYAWSDGTASGDRAAWTEFLGIISQYRREFPNLKLAHFSTFERHRLAEYAARYQMEGEPTVQWLLGSDSPFFDLKGPVYDSFVLPVTGYGLKYICKDPRIVNFQWELKESGSQWSVVRYHDYLLSKSEQERASARSEILSYNRDDVRATRAIEEWLRARMG